ncbi:acyl-CoA dehydrogenase [Embleya sp. NPDC005971]|uniref:acyl-CoA dehydrogenase n=1 Tax=unclassified Embleya TaxID=2699296 RepID=UPI0034002E83
MRFLERERAAAAKLLPGLDESLQAVPAGELEDPAGPGIGLFRDGGGPGLVVPASYGGRGASAVEAVRVQRALAGRSPSLAATCAVHHFSVAVLLGLAAVDDGGVESYLVQGLAGGNSLVACDFPYEGPDGAVLAPSMTAEVTPDGVRVTGATCVGALARSMDMLVAGVTIERTDGGGRESAVVLVPAESEGVNVDGTDGERVTLDDVVVAPEFLVRASALDKPLDSVLTAGFALYQLLATVAHVGAVDALVERVLRDGGVPESERIALLVETEGAMSAVEGVALRIDGGDPDDATLAHALYVRYGVQDALARIVPRAVELLGRLDTADADEVAHLAGVADALALCAPTRSRMTGPLAAYLLDAPLTLT